MLNGVAAAVVGGSETLLRVAFSQSGQDVRSECAIAPAEDRARAPLLVSGCCCWALARPSPAPSPFLASSLIYPADSVPQNTRLHGLSLAVAQCCAVALLGWAGLQTAGQQGAQGAQGAVPLLKITACMGV